MGGPPQSGGQKSFPHLTTKIHANSDDNPWENPQKSVIVRVFLPFVRIMQGRTPWVDSAYGFLGPGCCSCPGFHLRLGASDCSPGLTFCFMGPWRFAWICCAQLPYHQCKNRPHSTCFYSTGGHTPRIVMDFCGFIRSLGMFSEFA